MPLAKLSAATIWGRLKRWVALKNFLFGGTLCKTIENHGDGYPRASGADFSAANTWLALEEVLPCDHGYILAGHSAISNAILG